MVKVKMTQEDITEGVKQNCKLCPVARATRRALRNNGINYRIDVDDAWDPVAYNSHKTPKFELHRQDRAKVSNFIGAFDNGIKVKPITFRLVPIATTNLDYKDMEDFYEADAY